MRKLLIFLFLQATLLHAYTLVLNDNTTLKGELIFIDDTYTIIIVKNKEMHIPNTVIKKRFYTAQELAELAEMKRLKQLQLNSSAGIINQDLKNENDFELKLVQDNYFFENIKPIDPVKYNFYINFDAAPKLNTTITYPDNSKASASDNQDYVLSFGAEYNNVLSCKTRYSLGGLFQFDRTISSGKYSSNIFYARIEHPFDPKNENKLIGLELNMTMLRNFYIDTSTITNFRSSMSFGGAIYERTYFDNFFIETGIRNLTYIYEGTISTVNYKFNSDSFGLYLLTGLTF